MNVCKKCHPLKRFFCIIPCPAVNTEPDKVKKEWATT